MASTSHTYRPGWFAATLIGAGAIAAAVVTLGGDGIGRAAPATDPLDARREQVRALEAELSRIDVQTQQAADAYGTAAGDLKRLTSRVRTNSRALVGARRAHTRAQGRLQERLVVLYAQPPVGTTAVLLTSGSLSQTVAARELLDQIADGDARLASRARATRVRLASARQRLVRERRAAASRRAESAERLGTMRTLLADRQRVLDQAQVALDGLIAQREREAALARARRAAEQAARQRAASARAAARRAAASPAATPPSDPSPTPAATPSPAPSAPAPTPPAERPSSGGRSGSGPVAGGPSWATLDRIAQCESGGNPRAVSSSGTYRGKYQFDMSTWASVGGSGDPAAASEGEQDRRAALLYISRGPSPWPICGYR